MGAGVWAGTVWAAGTWGSNVWFETATGATDINWGHAVVVESPRVRLPNVDKDYLVEVGQRLEDRD